MGIQDLGAIGEFISSIVIVVTLIVLIYEVRGTKWATLEANAQERQRKADDLARSMAESPDLAGILASANQHLGSSEVAETATQFGLEPAEYARLTNHYLRVTLQMRDAYLRDLPEQEKVSLDTQIAFNVRQPAYAKWYDSIQANLARGGKYDHFYERVAEVRATL